MLGVVQPQLVRTDAICKSGIRLFVIGKTYSAFAPRAIEPKSCTLSLNRFSAHCWADNVDAANRTKTKLNANGRFMATPLRSVGLALWRLGWQSELSPFVPRKALYFRAMKDDKSAFR